MKEEMIIQFNENNLELGEEFMLTNENGDSRV